MTEVLWMPTLLAVPEVAVNKVCLLQLKQYILTSMGVETLSIQLMITSLQSASLVSGLLPETFFTVT